MNGYKLDLVVKFLEVHIRQKETFNSIHTEMKMSLTKHNVLFASDES